jgi:hypothetical protein
MAVIKDLTGKKYGKWSVLERGSKRGQRLRWICQCECGRKREIVASEIHANNARKDCGCSQRNWIGEKFNKLTVISKEGEGSFHNTHVLCRCDCGNLKRTWGSTLYAGLIKSCGCVHEENGKNRCLNFTYAGYKKRGLKVGLFELTKEQFYEISQKNCLYCGCKPNNVMKKETKTKGERTFIYNGIDRVDNSKGYTLENSVPCCGTCNRMKTNLGLEEWLTHMKKILDNVDSNLMDIISEGNI